MTSVVAHGLAVFELVVAAALGSEWRFVIGPRLLGSQMAWQPAGVECCTAIGGSLAKTGMLASLRNPSALLADSVESQTKGSR